MPTGREHGIGQDHGARQADCGANGATQLAFRHGCEMEQQARTHSIREKSWAARIARPSGPLNESATERKQS